MQLEAALAFLLSFDFHLRVFIRLRMFGDHALEFFLQLIAFVFEFVERTAPFLGDIGGEFDPIEGEVRAAQQFQFFTHHQDIAKDGRNLVLHGRDKCSNRAVIGSVPIRERNEDDVFMAGAFNLARTDQAFGVCQQDDFEQDLGMDGCCTNQIVVVALIKDRQVDVLVHQSVDGVLQGSRNKLVLE